MSEPTYKTGDVVRLKGGNTHMVVQRHEGPTGAPSIESLPDPTPCVWHDSDGHLHKDVFAAAVLERVGDPSML